MEKMYRIVNGIMNNKIEKTVFAVVTVIPLGSAEGMNVTFTIV